MSRLVNSTNNNNTSTTTDDEEHRINLLFPRCKVKSQSNIPSVVPVSSESESRGRKSESDFPNSLNRSSDSNANIRKVEQFERGGSRVDCSRNSPGLAPSSSYFPGRARRDVRGKPRRKEGYHCNISNQRHPPTHNHNSCRSPPGIDLRHISTSRTQQTASDINPSINIQKTADGVSFPEKLDKGSNPCPSFSFPEKMELDNSTVDEDSGHFDNGTGSGSNGSTFSESNTPANSGGSSAGSGGHPGLLHDSRIEIAGGREIFSQNKTRLGRRGRVVGGPTTSEYEPHFVLSPSGSRGRRKTLPTLQASNISPRYGPKKSPLGNTHQGPSTSTVWELQAERKEVPKQFGQAGAPRIRNPYRNYGSYRQHKHKSGHGYGQFRSRQSFPSYDYGGPSNSGTFHNFPREMSNHPSNSLPRVHGTIKETMFGTEVTSVEKSVVFDEMGRVLSCEHRAPEAVPKKSIVYGGCSHGSGEIVFDDIENWQEVEERPLYGYRPKSKSPNLSPPSSQVWDQPRRSGIGPNEDKRKLSSAEIMKSSGSLCPSIQLEGNTSPSGYESDEVSASAPAPPPHLNFLNENKRLIGSLPIAEYEGSPRRYGLYRQPPGAISMPNDLDLVDLSSGVGLMPSPSSTSLEQIGSSEGQEITIPDLPPGSINNKSSPNGGSKRAPGFPQRVLDHSIGRPAEAKQSSIPIQNSGDTDTEQSQTVAVLNSSENETRLVGRIEKGEERQERKNPEESSGEVLKVLRPESAECEVPVTSWEKDLNEATSLALSREQCDYLYEFSETRKVLEDFFHSNRPRGSSPSFDELDYRLRRQNGNSYVGQRLAGEIVVEESPKPRRGGREVVMSLGIPLELGEGSDFGSSPRLITLHDVSARSSISVASKNSPVDEGNRDVNDNDLDVETTSTNTETDLGETEIGHQVRHPRNYALSPETTDCDSNELESEMSLDYEVSIHSSSRVGTTMPVLEDGLSSGNVSENDEGECSRKHETGEAFRGHDTSPASPGNPTLLLMKKQITEIEKEIQLRATTSVTVTNSGAGNYEGGISSGCFLGDTFLEPPVEPSGALENSNSNANIKVHEVLLCDRRSNSSSLFDSNDPELEALDPMRPTPPPSPAPPSGTHPQHLSSSTASLRPAPDGTSITQTISSGKVSNQSLVGTMSSLAPNGLDLSTPTATESKESIPSYTSSEPMKLISSIMSPPDATKEPTSHRVKQYSLPKFDATSFTSLLPKPSSLSMTAGPPNNQDDSPQSELHESSSEERLGPHGNSMSPVWVPRRSLLRGDRNHHGSFGLRDPFLRKRYEEIPDDDADTDQETDRLLGQHRTEDEYGFYNEKEWKKTKLRGILTSTGTGGTGGSKGAPFPKGSSHVPGSLPSTNSHSSLPSIQNNSQPQQPPFQHLSLNSPTAESAFSELPLSLPASKPLKDKEGIKKKRNKEDLLKNPTVLIEGVLFRARYLGSTQLISEGQPTKATRMLQAEEAVSRIKAQANQNGLSDSTASLLSSSSSSLTLPLVFSTGTTTDDEPNSPRPFRTSHNDSSCLTQSQQPSYFELEHGIPEKKSEEMGEDGEEEESSEDVIENATLIPPGETYDFHSTHQNTSISQINSLSSDPSGSLGTRLRIQEVQASPYVRMSSFNSSPFHYCPPCGSGVMGTMFHLKFVGSLEVDEELGTGKGRRKRPKKAMVEEAMLELKAPDGETQPSTEVDLFISTEKIMVLNTDLKEIMMDHALRTISYIADIGDLVVLMARRRPVPTDTPEELSKIHRPPKMICHVFESDEAQYIAQSIGQAFQVAYMEFLKANGIEDHSFVREMDYQEVLNSQEIFGDELQMFAKKELQKDVVVPKAKGEILGVVIVESGWGSMLPTVVIANLAPAGAAARCGQLNIGDQIIAINGVSLVGLPLSTCQTYIKNSKTQTVVKLTVVPCPPVVEVKIKRPDTKYQLGFSVQNGVICSLLRGGIAERGGVRVGHRIIEINNQSVVAVPHEKIVNLLATSVGEINMKTMPTSMFRLLTGQETPLYI